VSNGKPIKEILPEVIRKLIVQRKHYLKQQRINRRKKNRDPNQPPLPGMKQGGQVAKKQTSVKDEVKRRMRKESPRTGYGVGLSPITHLRRHLHKKQIEKELKDRPEHLSPAKVSKKANGGVMASKEVYELANKLKNKDRLTTRDIERAEKLTKSFGKGKGKSSRGKGPHARSTEELLKEAYPGQFRNENNEAFAPEFHTKGRARGGFVKKAGGTKRVPGSGAATKGTNFEGIF